MGFELSEKRSYMNLLFTPGPIITIIGLLILIVSVFFFNSAAPDGPGVDAILEAQGNSGQQIKSMVGLVMGTLVSIAGVLISLMAFSRK